MKLPTPKLLIPIALFLLVAAPIAVTSIKQGATHSALTESVAEAREEQARLKPEIDRIHQLNRQTQELDHRIDVVRELDKASTYLVEVLDDVSQIMPEYMWLTSMEEDEKRPSTLMIEGMTFTNLAVADLMVRLDKLGQFDDVVLVTIEEKAVDGRRVLRFEIETRMRYTSGGEMEVNREHS